MDSNDYSKGQKNKLPSLNILQDVACLTQSNKGETKIFHTKHTLNILIINNSASMAQTITEELKRQLGNLNIYYAPSLRTSEHILKAKQIDMVLSSSILADGKASMLRPLLSKLPKRPLLIIIGQQKAGEITRYNEAGYQFSAYRNLSDISKTLRNDLNNPLQEIVAMVFVAKATEPNNDQVNAALTAIENTARNMAEYIYSFENNIY